MYKRQVGIDGAESAFESYLRGEAGVREQELSTSGKVVSESWYTDPLTGETHEPEPGDNVLLTLECWTEVHPALVSIPVDWDYTISYGLLYSLNPVSYTHLYNLPACAASRPPGWHSRNRAPPARRYPR